jgi:F0F1-type ATP synthase membrane subunit b/b'
MDGARRSIRAEAESALKDLRARAAAVSASLAERLLMG